MKSYNYGLLAGASMFAIYFSLLFFIGGWSHAVSQTLLNLPFIVLLVIGFGIQVTLFFHVRQLTDVSTNKEVVASGGMSMGSMAACCAHHLVDFGILLGISGLLAFIAKFQTGFFVLAIASNAYGIAVMLSMIKKRGLYGHWTFLKQVANAWPAEQGKNAVLVLAVFLVPLSFLAPLLVVSASPSLGEKSISVNGVDVKVTPVLENEVLKLSISLDTHSGDLGADLEKDAFVTDLNENKYYGKWSGSPVGGHHRSGSLTFQSFSGSLSSFYVESLNGVPVTITWP